MNKEVIIKYKEVFNYWLGGGNVCFKHKNGSTWFNTNSPCWSSNEIYVQDDGYVEFRKALADGKDVYYNHFGKWKKLSDLEGTFFTAGDLTLDYSLTNPNKPEFKAGDWVRDKTNCTIVKLGEHYHKGGIVHWKPEFNEVVILLDLPSPRIMKLKNLGNVDYAIIQFKKGKCIPYIGQPLEEMI